MRERFRSAFVYSACSLAALVAAGTASAAQVEGTLVVPIGDIATFDFPGTGEGESQGPGQLATVDEGMFDIAATLTDFSDLDPLLSMALASVTVAGAFDDDGQVVEEFGTNAAGSFQVGGGSNGLFGGAMPIEGEAQVEFNGGPPLTLDLSTFLGQPELTEVELGSSLVSKVLGGPWTAGTVVYLPDGSVETDQARAQFAKDYEAEYEAIRAPFEAEIELIENDRSLSEREKAQQIAALEAEMSEATISGMSAFLEEAPAELAEWITPSIDGPANPASSFFGNNDNAFTGAVAEGSDDRDAEGYGTLTLVSPLALATLISDPGEYSPTAATLTLTYLPSGPDLSGYGDVDGDGSTTVNDVQCTILAVLAELGGGEAPACVAPDGFGTDLNCDDQASVVDVQLAINLALGAGLDPAIDANANDVVDACEE